MAEISQYVANALAGDKKAFEQLYLSSQQQVYFTCLSFVKNEADAKDMMQSTYLTAYEKLNTLTEPDKFQPWINRIAVNTCKNFLGRRTVESIDDEEKDFADTLVDEDFLPDDYVTDKDKRRIVMDIIRSSLSEVQYQSVIMFYFNEMSISEIAESMDCPEGTVKFRLNAARSKIKKGVLEYEEHSGEKLYTIVGTPFLTRLLISESESVSVPKIGIDCLLPENCSVISDAIVKNTTGKALLGAAKGKALAAICAAAVTGGGVTAAFIASENSPGHNKEQKEKAALSSAFVSEQTEIDGKSSLPYIEYNDGITEGETEEFPEERERLEKIKPTVDAFLAGCKEGDLEKIISLSSPGSYLEEFMKNSNEEEQKIYSEFLKKVYKELVWDFSFDDSVNIVVLKNGEYDKKKTVNFFISYIDYDFYFDSKYFYTEKYIEDGERIAPPKIESYEQAFELLDNLQEIMPKMVETAIALNIDSNGGITVDSDAFFDNSFDRYYSITDGLNPECLRNMILGMHVYETSEYTKTAEYDYPDLKETDKEPELNKKIVEELKAKNDIELFNYISENCSEFKEDIKDIVSADADRRDKYSEYLSNCLQIVSEEDNKVMKQHSAVIARYSNFPDMEYVSNEEYKKFVDDNNAYCVRSTYYSDRRSSVDSFLAECRRIFSSF